MARGDRQYLEKLAFLLDQRRAFDVAPYEAPPDEWTREDKARLTRLFNETRLATSTTEISTRKSPDDFRYMIETLRPFAKGFSARDGYDLNRVEKLTPAKKRKLIKYYNEAVMRASRPFQLYQSRSKKAMDVARKAAGEEAGFPLFKGVFLPTQSLGERARVRVDTKRGIVEIKSRTHSVTVFYWEMFGVKPEDIANDPIGVTNYVTSQIGAKQYSINAGEHSVGKGVPKLYTASVLGPAIQRLIERYGEDNYDPDDSNSHYYGNWLTGVRAYDFSNINNMREWTRASRAESDARKRTKAMVRKRVARSLESEGRPVPKPKRGR